MVNAVARGEPKLGGSNQFHIVQDDAAGLLGVIAIDSTILGPAAGGCRFWNYPSVTDMHADALRLARGMTLKNAMAGLPLGGGKAVLQVPQRPFDRARLFEAFGAAVEALQGEYVTAEDVGTTVMDMQVIRRRTAHVAGLDPQVGRAGGDPSPWTALGVFLAMEVAAQAALGARVCDLTVAVQGAGNVGSHLCALLVKAGARVIVSDISRERCEALAERYGVAIAAPDAIASAEADVYAPCALGGALTADSVFTLRARLVCGGANNQIAGSTVVQHLLDAGIVYVPDYIANAGGIISVAAEYLGESSSDVEARVRQIPGRVGAILARADRDGRSPASVADDMAEEILKAGRKPAAP